MNNSCSLLHTKEILDIYIKTIGMREAVEIGDEVAERRWEDFWSFAVLG